MRGKSPECAGKPALRSLSSGTGEGGRAQPPFCPMPADVPTAEAFPALRGPAPGPGSPGMSQSLNPRRAPLCPPPAHSLSRVPVPLPGLCALSINHANSYLAYPGSATSGEIALYDGNTLVSAKLSLWIPAGAENKQSHSKANGALGKDE